MVDLVCLSQSGISMLFASGRKRLEAANGGPLSTGVPCPFCHSAVLAAESPGHPGGMWALVEHALE